MARRETETGTAMEKNVERLLNRVSLVFAVIATLALLHLFSHSSLACSPAPSAYLLRRDARPDGRHLVRYPHPASFSVRSSCDISSREVVTPDKRFAKLRFSRAWRKRVDAFAALFATFRPPALLSNASHVLCVSAGAGHEVAALQESGVSDVTGVDLLDFHPLVRRADPHNLPFFDNVFDLGFSTGLSGALFPVRFVAELERTVRRGGAVVLAVDHPSAAQEVEGIKALFKRSSLFERTGEAGSSSYCNLPSQPKVWAWRPMCFFPPAHVWGPPSQGRQALIPRPGRQRRSTRQHRAAAT